jgi:hypothetical protein
MFGNDPICRDKHVRIAAIGEISDEDVLFSIIKMIMTLMFEE